MGPRWSLCSGQLKAGPEYGDERKKHAAIGDA
jgi:hypothetical protein